MRTNITVTNRNRKHHLNEKLIKEAATIVLEIIRKYPGALEIDFLSNKAIRPINKRYKGHDRATDVLSFDLGSCHQVLISSDMALGNSRAFGTSFEEELVLYVIHGILHLAGYNDEKQRDRLKMFKKQDSIMEILCAKVNLSKVLTRR